MTVGRLMLAAMLALCVLSAGVNSAVAGQVITQGSIITGKNAAPLEVYAARELQKYLYALSGTLLPILPDDAAVDKPAYIVGRVSSNRRIAELAAGDKPALAFNDPAEQGYLLKKLEVNGNEVTVIAGADPEGVLYGVYGLLEDHYGVGFYMSGDILPEKKVELVMAAVDEKKAPRQKVRGFTNHWCYMQGSGLWSFEDWKYYIDQMARMRLNMVSFHNYLTVGYTEIFLNTEEFKRRNANQHSNLPGGFHKFSMPVREYPWRSADLFNDYAYATAATLHNESLDNRQVAMKGVALMQQIIAYAHRRGVMVNLGAEFHLHKPELQLKLAEYIAKYYPDLDQVVYYRDEGKNTPPFVRLVYDYLKEHAPKMGHVLTGWGEITLQEDVPADVVAGPFSFYHGKFESGARYGAREFWAGPWLESDGGGEMHYAPPGYRKTIDHNCRLSDVVASYQKAASNLNGLVTLTWRVTDAIDPKLAYIAKAPWDLQNRLTTSRLAYLDYARCCYGEANEERMADIINENEPVVVDSWDCFGRNRVPDKKTKVLAEIAKADAQLAVIDQCIAATSDSGQVARLRLLRNRILGVKLHHGLYESVATWEGLPGAYADWTQSYLDRVIDMCTLGQLVSAHQMTVKDHYVKAETGLRTNQTVRAPSLVVARGTPGGAVITWRNEERDVTGFHVYRDGQKLTSEPLDATAARFEEKFNGVCSYRVSALNARGEESPLSVKAAVAAGQADREAPRVVVISPPTVGVVGQPVDIEVRATDGRAYDCLNATLYYRAPGQWGWNKARMLRRCRAIFAFRIPSEKFTERGLEYYASVCDGANTGFYPVTAPELPARIVAETLASMTTPGAPGKLELAQDGRTFTWPAAAGDVFAYRLYRSRDAKCSPGRASLLTYVAECTTSFQDKEPDFEDRPLNGVYYYRVAAIDKAGNESGATQALAVDYGSGLASTVK